MTAKILFSMLVMIVVALAYIIGHKAGMRRGKKVTLAVQAEIRRRERKMADAL